MAEHDPDPPVLPPRKRGRPRALNPLCGVSAALPAALVDRLCRLAKQRDESLSKVIRVILTARVPPR